MRLRSICPVVREGIGWDETAQGRNKLSVDIRKDRTEKVDGIHDIIKFFDGNLAYTIKPDTYACLVFSESGEMLSSLTDNLNMFEGNIDQFYEEYLDILEEIFARRLEERDLDRLSKFYSAKDEQLADIKNTFKRLANKHKINNPDIFVDSLIEGRTQQGVDGYKITALSRPRIRTKAKGHSSTVTKEAKKDYQKIKNSLMKALNTGAQISPTLRDIMDVVLERFFSFVTDNQLGFMPDLLIRTVSTTIRPVFDTLVNEMAYVLGIPLIQGISKVRTNISYDGITLVDKQGTINPNIPSGLVGPRYNLQDAAQDIIAGRFKITNIYPANRHKFGNLFKVTPQLNQVMTNPDLNILVIDDSIYSGTTTDSIMRTIKGSYPSISNIACYGIIKV